MMDSPNEQPQESHRTSRGPLILRYGQFVFAFVLSFGNCATLWLLFRSHQQIKESVQFNDGGVNFVLALLFGVGWYVVQRLLLGWCKKRNPAAPSWSVDPVLLANLSLGLAWILWIPYYLMLEDKVFGVLILILVLGFKVARLFWLLCSAFSAATTLFFAFRSLGGTSRLTEVLDGKSTAWALIGFMVVCGVVARAPLSGTLGTFGRAVECDFAFDDFSCYSRAAYEAEEPGLCGFARPRKWECENYVLQHAKSPNTCARMPDPHDMRLGQCLSHFHASEQFQQFCDQVRSEGDVESALRYDCVGPQDIDRRFGPKGRTLIMELVLKNMAPNRFQQAMNLHPNLNLQDNDGNTVLHLAPYVGYIDSLLRGGADPRILNAKKQNAPMLWAQKGMMVAFERPALDLLLQRGLDLNAQDADGNTLLHYAMRVPWQMRFGSPKADELAIMKDFLREGARLSIPNNEGKTAKTLGEENGRAEYVDTRWLEKEHRRLESYQRSLPHGARLTDFAPGRCTSQRGADVLVKYDLSRYPSLYTIVVAQSDPKAVDVTIDVPPVDRVIVLILVGSGRKTWHIFNPSRASITFMTQGNDDNLAQVVDESNRIQQASPLDVNYGHLKAIACCSENGGIADGLASDYDRKFGGLLAFICSNTKTHLEIPLIK